MMIDPTEALSPYRPGVDGPWSRAEASHLCRRAGFGAPPELVASALEMSPPEATRQLLVARDEVTGVDFVRDNARKTASIESAQAAWVYALLFSANPAREKLALFWHGHFATSARKVESAPLMMRQIELFRQLGAGPFGPLLHAVARDPAMLIWLDGNANRRGRPNENFARELMELFALGIGNYTEADIKEAARAFTGWHVRAGEFRLSERAHDPGEKTVLGSTGTLDGDDIVDLCLTQGACSRWIARALFEFYVAPELEDALLDELAAEYERTGKDTGRFLQTLLSSRVFYSDGARRALVSTPVDHVIGTLRSLGGRASPDALTRALAEMGQDLYRPPSVKGWASGLRWLTSTTLIARYRFASAVLGRGEDNARFDWTPLEKDGSGPIELLFPEGLPEPVAAAAREAAAGDVRVLTESCVQLPEYQFI